MAKLDFRAGLPPRKPGRKLGQKDSKPRQTSNNISLDNYIYIDRDKLILVDDMEEVSSARDLKSQMTVKELNFIQILVTQAVREIDAIKAAGYESKNEKYLYFLARKIIEKYESQAADHRKIFRALGAGEVRICRGLLSIAEDKKNPADVRRKAWADLASCMGLKSEVVESFQGVSIIIRGENDGDLPPGSQGKPLALPAPPKVTQIIK